MRDRAELAGMLAESLGAEKATETIEVAAEALGLGTSVTDQDALRVLAHIAEQPGLVGIAARFAKSRAHLRWDIPRSNPEATTAVSARERS